MSAKRNIIVAKLNQVTIDKNNSMSFTKNKVVIRELSDY